MKQFLELFLTKRFRFDIPPILPRGSPTSYDAVPVNESAHVRAFSDAVLSSIRSLATLPESVRSAAARLHPRM